MRSECLTRVREAFRARGKSLRHRVLAWSCERGEQDGHESIEFTFDHSGPLLRLKVWEDGAVWFCARAMKAGRVVFETTFYAVAGDEDPAELVQAIECAFLVDVGSTDAAAMKDGYVAALATFSPYDVHWKAYCPALGDGRVLRHRRSSAARWHSRSCP